MGEPVQGFAEAMLPLQAAMGLEMEIGPALDWLSTNLTTGPYSPLWWLTRAGGVGGGGGLAWRTSEVDDLVQELKAAGFRVSAAGRESFTPTQIEAMDRYQTAYNLKWSQGCVTR